MKNIIICILNTFFIYLCVMRNNVIHDDNPFDFNKLEITKEALELVSDLSKTGLRMYNYIYHFSYRKDGILYFDKKEAKFELNFRESKSIYNGINELLNKGILARRKSNEEFYYNPKYINN